MTQASRRIDKAEEAISAQPTTLWLGSTQGGLQWLWRQIASSGPQTNAYSTKNNTMQHRDDLGHETINPIGIAGELQQNIQRITDSGTQRIICGVRNRADLDSLTIDKIKSACSDIPLALAVDTWFDGSRRTGLGETGALLLPWSRWWDGWHEWLNTPAAGTLDAWTNATAHLTAPEQACHNRIPGGLIVADCHETADGWLSALHGISKTAAENTKCVSSKLYRKHADQPNWILLDDTADLLDVQQADGPGLVVKKVRLQYPDSLIIVATTISRVDQWIPIQGIERCESIAKPSTGRSIRSLLKHYFE